MPSVQLPDGSVAAFPDSMPQDQIASVIRQKFPPQEQQPGGLSQLWEGLKHDVREAPAAAVSTAKQMATEIPQEAGSALGDLWKMISGGLTAGRGSVPTSEAREAAGRTAGRIGDIATLATGGGFGPEAPPAARMLPKQAMPAASPQQQMYQDFRTLSMKPSVPAIAQSRPAAPVFNQLRAMPMAPIERGLQQNIQQAGQAAGRVADQFNPAVGAEQAGRTAQEAIKAYAEDSEQTARDYGEFYRQMHGAKPVDLTNTLQTLKDLYGRYPSAPRLSQIFTNPKLQSMMAELEPRTKETTSPILGPSGSTIVTRERVGGTLTIPELRDLHTRVRYMMSEPAVGPETIPKADLARVYSALKRDMTAAATARGPEALTAMQRADANYRARAQILERLESITKADNPERAFARLNAAAQGTSTADIGLLQTARDVIPPEQWKDVGAAMIRRLGYPTAEVGPSELGPDFSLTAFSRNWNKLTPKAKDALFGESFPGTPRASLDAIGRVGANKALAGQPSFGAKMLSAGIGGAFVEHTLRSAASGRSVVPEIVGLTGVYALSKLLMSQTFARMLYQETMRRPPLQPIPGAAGIPAAQQIGQAGFAASTPRRDPQGLTTEPPPN